MEKTHNTNDDDDERGLFGGLQAGKMLHIWRNLVSPTPSRVLTPGSSVEKGEGRGEPKIYREKNKIKAG